MSLKRIEPPEKITLYSDEYYMCLSLISDKIIEYMKIAESENMSENELPGLLYLKALHKKLLPYQLGQRRVELRLEENEQEQEKQHFWDIHEENGLLNLLDPDKHMHAYVKWDGEIHVWYYDDNAAGFDHDTGLEDHTDWGFEGKSHHDYYDMFDIDEQIARLQSLREIAAKWFAEHGKRWPPDWENYEQGKIDIVQAQELPEVKE